MRSSTATCGSFRSKSVSTLADSEIHLSIVIPAFNESERIGGTLDSFTAYLAQQDYAYEIIVVDDGSSDDTSGTVTHGITAQTWPHVNVIQLPANRGKGRAVAVGLVEARGAYRFFADADASTPIEEIEKFWPKFQAGADIVIASRSLPESDVRVHQAWYRENMGKIFNVILKLLALTPFKDTQCGFKGYTADAVEKVIPKQRIDGFAFDVEQLYIAQRLGLHIEEVAVTWVNSKRTTVNPISDSARMILESIGIRLNAILGRYT